MQGESILVQKTGDQVDEQRCKAISGCAVLQQCVHHGSAGSWACPAGNEGAIEHCRLQRNPCSSVPL